MNLAVVSEILSAADNVVLAEVKGPEEGVKDGEKEVGTLPDDLIKLCGYYSGLSDRLSSSSRQMAKGAISALLEGFFLDDDGQGLKESLTQLKSRKAEIYPLQTAYSLAKEIFWAEVRKTFGLEAADNIGIRKDWKVVEVSAEFSSECRDCDKKEDCPVSAM